MSLLSLFERRRKDKAKGISPERGKQPNQGRAFKELGGLLGHHSKPKNKGQSSGGIRLPHQERQFI